MKPLCDLPHMMLQPWQNNKTKNNKISVCSLWRKVHHVTDVGLSRWWNVEGKIAQRRTKSQLATGCFTSFCSGFCCVIVSKRVVVFIILSLKLHKTLPLSRGKGRLFAGSQSLTYFITLSPSISNDFLEMFIIYLSSPVWMSWNWERTVMVFWHIVENSIMTSEDKLVTMQVRIYRAPHTCISCSIRSLSWPSSSW